MALLKANRPVQKPPQVIGQKDDCVLIWRGGARWGFNRGEYTIHRSRPRITVCVPIYGRPARTLRAIDCILNQDINNWEAILIGDNCPDFNKLLNVRSGCFNADNGKQVSGAVYGYRAFLPIKVILSCCQINMFNK